MVETNKKIAPYIFISPFIILFLVFGLFPIFYSITISFFKWTVAGPQEFRGLRNYISLLTSDPFFKNSLNTTFILLVFGSLLQHVFAIPLAIMLNNENLKGRDFFKILYFLPYITSTVVIALVFSQLYDQNYGWLNYILTNWFNSSGVKWVQDPVAIKASISIMVNWRFIGWNTIIYLAGLQSVDKSLYEAASIDGARGFKMHWHITVPLLMPIIFFAVSLSIIGGMQLFEEPFVLMRGYEYMGGPENAGLTSAYYLLATGFNFNRFGKASAIAWILFIIIMFMTFINKLITDRLQK
ncbi:MULTISPECIES: carbohydrate ABC transporter permease [unclassified Oceanispirochaeta]|uniref:carbohydrate ABC transporter permease n=1 Tax=unclassified Oceanispirochaeta TaxID=2635722 RepID=UPI000E08DF22|nr:MULTISPECIES: sugar ABC transporter permease [unclassified Oceanispirochaeta]MBF9017431.1 sugar ABC transporter permease [Oceanispirochaeta sp. M2]NPD74003.1 sugar ABC transporter permease [Oceanispirochaeta sp. M1]RDG30176.1 sugar ABC transporter permease [Oceanispirochaeta sp. M1]